MPGQPYVLAEATYKNVSGKNASGKNALGTKYEVAVLPWGATEPHNYHLPYATDNFEATAVAVESARLAWEHGARVVVLPTIPFGVNAQQLDLPLAINMNPSTQANVLADVIDSLERQQVSKLVVLNFHGGNDFRQMIRQLQANTSVFLSVVNAYAIVPYEGYFDEGGDHANEMETSLMLHLAPELVAPLSEAGPGKARAFRIAALRESWAWAPRHWSQVTEDTGVGDPRAATAEKGDRYFQAVTKKIAEFFIDLAAADLDDLYE